jgi:hypothetical protein
MAKLILKETEEQYKYPNAIWGCYSITFDKKE